MSLLTWPNRIANRDVLMSVSGVPDEPQASQGLGMRPVRLGKNFFDAAFETPASKKGGNGNAKADPL